MKLSQYQKTLPKSVLEIVYLLRNGNDRFVENKLKPKDLVAQRQALVEKQMPKAIILTCSDSRVDPNYIFDADLGLLFILRNAGNVVDENVIGSVEFAAHHLETKLLIVMGHDSCGAVIAAINKEKKYPHLVHTLDLIIPATKVAQKFDSFQEQLLNATIENIKLQMQAIVQGSDLLNEMVDSHKLHIVGAYYHLNSGKVDLI